MSSILLRVCVFHHDKFTCEISLKFRFQSKYKLIGRRNRSSSMKQELNNKFSKGFTLQSARLF